jgi:RNA polymerase sigma-70 factor (ECF subfamily)
VHSLDREGSADRATVSESGALAAIGGADECRDCEALPDAVQRMPGMWRRRLNDDEDAALVARAQAGERAAFEELVQRHAEGLYAVVSRIVWDRHEAEEVTQEAFLRAWRGIGGFKGNARFFTWLYRIGVNEARRRAQQRGPAAAIASLDEHQIEPADPRPAPDRQAEHNDLRDALEGAIKDLDPDYRTPLVLRDIEGLSTAEAAAIMGLGEAAFKSRLHRARLAVRNAVEDHLDKDDDRC